MTEKPTLKIDVQEWKMLSVQSSARLAEGINSLIEYLNKQSVINPQIVSEIDAHWIQARAEIDRRWGEVQVRLKGWEQHSRPLIAEWEAQQAQQQPTVMDDLADQLKRSTAPSAQTPEPIKRGGWPKGMKRGPRKAKPSSAAVLPPVTQ